MLSISHIKPAIEFMYHDAPYVALDVTHKHIGRGGSVLSVKMKNLITGNIISESLRQSDRFEEVELSHKDIKYLYSHRGEYWFSNPTDQSKRFQLQETILGNNTLYLKNNMIVDAILFNEDIINIKLPIKIEYTVKEAPPSIKGNTAQGGTKQIIIETGASITAPLFIQTGDIITVNTETGTYVDRAHKV